MIDKNGKLFGKINIIDFIVILVLVAAVAIFAASKLQGVVKTEEEIEKNIITMEFTADEVPEYVIPHIKNGDAVYDSDNNSKLGTLKSCKVDESRSYSANDNGEIILGSKEGYKSVVLVVEVEGAEIKDNGVDVEGTKYGVGHTFTLRSGFAKLYLKVSNIIK